MCWGPVGDPFRPHDGGRRLRRQPPNLAAYYTLIGSGAEGPKEPKKCVRMAKPFHTFFGSLATCGLNQLVCGGVLRSALHAPRGVEYNKVVPPHDDVVVIV